VFIKKIGIDLGTANTLIHLPKKGIVINEPTMIAVLVDKQGNFGEHSDILAVGEEAKQMIGRTPENIIAHKPLKDGVIADYKATQAMLKYFIDKVTKPVRFLRPEVMIAVPAGITSTEQRVVIEAAMKAGAKDVYLLKEPVAAAIGSGIPIDSASGRMVVDIGGGTTEAAVISLGGIVTSQSIKVGGDKFDQAITKFIKQKYKLGIGEQIAEQIKIKSASALPYRQGKQVKIEGSDLVDGLPKTITINSNELTQAIEEPLAELILGIKKVLQNTPPQLAADVIHQGIALSGGGGKLKNLDKLINQVLKIECYVTQEPLLDVVKGVGRVLENLAEYKQALWAIKKR